MLTKSAESWKIMFRNWGKANKQGTLGYRATFISGFRKHLRALVLACWPGGTPGRRGQWASGMSTFDCRV